MLKRYLKQIFETAQQGDAREESFTQDRKLFLEMGKQGKALVELYLLKSGGDPALLPGGNDAEEDNCDSERH